MKKILALIVLANLISACNPWFDERRTFYSKNELLKLIPFNNTNTQQDDELIQDSQQEKTLLDPASQYETQYESPVAPAAAPQPQKYNYNQSGK